MKFVNKYIICFFVLAVSEVFAQINDSLTIAYNYVNSIPQNADIYLNDSLIGKTPMHFRWMSGGVDRKITLKLKGYAVFDYALSKDEKIINKTFKLIPVAGMKEKEIVTKNDFNTFSKSIKTGPIILSTAVTAVSAVMAFYFKSLAIDKGDEFEQTGDPTLLDKKKKYDLLGGISIVIFQVGFCALIYFYFLDN